MSLLRALRARYAVSAEPLRTQRRIELVALLLGLLVCLQLVYGLVMLALTTGPAAIEPAADSMRVPAVVNAHMVTAQERNEIITRPLFWVGRRPVDSVAVLEEPDTEQGSPGKLDSVKLVGVFGGGTTAGVIVLVHDEKRRILLGEELDGWTLKSVEPGECVFVSGARRETIVLLRSAEGAGGGVASAPTTSQAVRSRQQMEVRGPAPESKDEQAGGAAGKGKGNGARVKKAAAPTDLGFGSR